MINLARYLIDLPLLPAVLLKATLVLCVGWIFHFVLARKNPRWQVLLWRGVMVGIFMMTLLVPMHTLSIPIVRPSEPVLRADVLPMPGSGAGSVAVSDLATAIHTEARSVADSPGVEASQPSFSLPSWVSEHGGALVFGTWLGVVLVLGLRLVIGYGRVIHRVRSSCPGSEPVQQILHRIARDLHCHRKIELRCSPDLATPFLCGLFRPTIILPVQMQDPEYETRLPAILTHEMVHFLSGDLIWMLVTRLFSTVFWFHPLAWKLCDAHGKACETVCDGVAADYVGDADRYAAVLADVALRVSGRLPGLAGIPMAREANIVTRLRRLKQKIDSAPLTRQSVAICVLAGVILFTGLGGLNFVHADTDSHPPQDTASHDGTPTEGEIVALGPHEAESRSAVRETSDEAIWVPLPVILPKRTFEPRRGSPRLDFLVHRDVTNVALNKPVTASTDPPIKGTLAQIVDGDKEPVMEAEVELGRGTQWVQVDLESPHELSAVLFWHFHRQERVYYDVVVQVADDPGFTRNVRTLFNNDDDNSSGLGVGRDQHYLETYEGKLVNAGQVVAQYVRLSSNENTLNDRSHYLEVEVYGRPIDQNEEDTVREGTSHGVGIRDDGGPVVDGLQVCISTEKRVWRHDEAPKMRTDVLVVGKGELGFLYPPMGACLEFDGTEYWPVAAGAMSIPHPPLRTSIYGMAGTLGGDGFCDSKGHPVVLTPGKHTIRAVFYALPPEGSVATSRPIYSNLLEIVIGEDDTPR